MEFVFLLPRMRDLKVDSESKLLACSDAFLPILMNLRGWVKLEMFVNVQLVGVM